MKSLPSGEYNSFCISTPMEQRVMRKLASVKIEQWVLFINTKDDTYIFIETRMRTKGATQPLEDQSNVVRVTAGEGSRNNVSMHHHTMNMILVQSKVVE